MKNFENTARIRALSSRAMLLAGVCLLTAPAVPAFAQTAPAAPTRASGAVEEVVVTAQKRSENLQNVPVAVTAVTSDSLQAQGIQTNLDLDQIIPGLNMTRAIGIDELPFIRGIGTTQQGIGVETPVATYVDGVYIYSQAAAALTLHDIDQIAVLKGPQGTLFGRNAVGGLIQYTTKAPSHGTHIEADATIGNVGIYQANFYGTTGLTDNIAVSLAANLDQQDQGFGKNLYNNEWVYTHRGEAFRGKLLWQPDSKTDVTLQASYVDYTSAEPVNRIAGNRTILGVVEPGGPWNIDANYQPRAADQGVLDSLTIKRDLGFAQLVSITAYQGEHTYTQFDADGTVLAVQQNHGPGEDSTVTQELQLISPDTGGKFSWVAGVFYLSSQNAATADNCGAYFPPGNMGPCSNSWSSTIGGLSSVAGFAQGTYHIDASTNLTAGIRYSSDDRSAESFKFVNPTTGATIAGTDAGPLGTAVVNVHPANIRFSDPTWRVSLDHRFSPELMGYISYNRGFRSGEFGNLGTAATATAPAYPATPINPETLDAYEVGFKADLFDRHLRIDGAAYYYQDHNHVSFQIVNGSSIALQSQLATMYGLDADAIWRFSDQFSVKAGVAAEHAYYNQFGNNACLGSSPVAGQALYGCGIVVSPTVAVGTGANLLPQNNFTIGYGNDSGHNVESTPDFTLSLAPTYVLPTSLGEFRTTVTYYYNDGWYAAPSNYSKQAAYSTVAAEVLLRPAFNNNLQFRVWAANLTNSTYAEQYTETSPGPNYQVAPGRTYGITLSVRY